MVIPKVKLMMWICHLTTSKGAEKNWCCFLWQQEQIWLDFNRRRL